MTDAAPFFFDIKVSMNVGAAAQANPSAAGEMGDGLRELPLALTSDFPRELRSALIGHVTRRDETAQALLPSQEAAADLEKALARLMFETVSVGGGGARLRVRLVSLQPAIDVFGPDLSVFDTVLRAYAPEAFAKVMKTCDLDWASGYLDFEISLSDALRREFAEALQAAYPLVADPTPVANFSSPLLAVREDDFGYVKADESRVVELTARPVKRKWNAPILAMLVAAGYAMLMIFAPQIEEETRALAEAAKAADINFKIAGFVIGEEALAETAEELEIGFGEWLDEAEDKARAVLPQTWVDEGSPETLHLLHEADGL